MLHYRKNPFLFCYFNKFVFSAEFPQQKHHENRQLGAESFQADRHEAGNSRFSQY
jgi:hypothetical protein